MAKRNRNTTSNTIERRAKGGRGTGTGKDYKPWLNIQDVASMGQLNRLTSRTVGREHQLMSELERNYLLVFDWLPQIVDIREQYPLLPLDETQQIAETLGVEHPKDPRTREPIVMTTDFVLTLNGTDGPIERAVAVKPAGELQKLRVVQKLEIERLFWEVANVSWCIGTDRDLDRTFVKNVALLHGYHSLADIAYTSQEVEDIAAHLTARVREPLALSKIAMDVDRSLGLQPGTSLAIAYHLMATRRWKIDMLVPINPSKPVPFVVETTQPSAGEPGDSQEVA